MTNLKEYVVSATLLTMRLISAEGVSAFVRERIAFFEAADAPIV
ncbi:MAG: hypothetical protein PHU01_13390 [Desulfuromonadaceae bacterium]|nr:hypothetical protein [Desulfuromonadaceae bacterium]